MSQTLVFPVTPAFQKSHMSRVDLVPVAGWFSFSFPEEGL